jgi:DNA-binding NarL/FixJ family response regulator
MKIRVSIADDHPLILRGLQNLLSNHTDIEVSGIYENGSDLLAGLAENAPDVLLLDIQMPDKNGLELTSIISHQFPAVGIIALTNLDSQFYIKSMLNQGALGYILKNSNEDILLEAIKTVYNREPYLEPTLRERTWRTMIKGQHVTSPDGGHSLTRREKEILLLIAKEFTSQEIADKLFLSLRTVETHRMNLMLKLGAKNMIGLVKAAIQMGLVE